MPSWCWTKSWCRARPRLAEGPHRQPFGLGATSNARGDELIRKSVAWTWKVKLSLSLERDLFTRLREDAEAVAIKVFGDNLRDLLLAAPAGKRVVMGLDPGHSHGGEGGGWSATPARCWTRARSFPHEPRLDVEGSLHALGKLVATHGVNLIAIGNGTASRETDALAAELIKRIAKLAPDVKLDRVVVSEAGASVYSASEFASKELPELDVSLRGAVSIARRLQDPLAELVKIDPKSIGVGPIPARRPTRASWRARWTRWWKTASTVSAWTSTRPACRCCRACPGLSGTVAASIVRWRDAHGAFRNRQQLLDVTGLGPRTFEQAAGFLRIRDGDNPLDQTGGAPRDLPAGAEAAGRHATPHRTGDGQERGAAHAEGRAVCRRPFRRHHRQGHPGRAGKARPRSAPRFQGGALQ